MYRKFQRRNVLLVLLVGATLAALIYSECFILNTTASVPRGLWLKLDTLPKKATSFKYRLMLSRLLSGCLLIIS